MKSNGLERKPDDLGRAVRQQRPGGHILVPGAVHGYDLLRREDSVRSSGVEQHRRRHHWHRPHPPPDRTRVSIRAPREEGDAGAGGIRGQTRGFNPCQRLPGAIHRRGGYGFVLHRRPRNFGTCEKPSECLIPGRFAQQGTPSGLFGYLAATQFLVHSGEYTVILGKLNIGDGGGIVCVRPHECKFKSRCHRANHPTGSEPIVG